MENTKDLDYTEMVEISGGVNPAYEIGYALGSCLRDILLIKGLWSLMR